MNNFKEFYNVFEIFDTTKINQIDVQLKPGRYNNDRLTYDFKVAQAPGLPPDDYKLKLHKTTIETSRYSYETMTDNVYDVTFSGPNSVDPTNKYVWAQVYTHMLAGVKKLLDDYKPDGLHFYGATSGMDLVYDKFFKKFLADSPGKPDYLVFYRLNDKDYISKKFYTEHPEFKEDIDQYMKNWAVEEEKYIKDKKQNRVSIREMVKEAIKKIGHFIWMKEDGYLGLIYQVDPEYVKSVALCSWMSTLTTRETSMYKTNEQEYGKVFYNPAELAMLDKNLLNEFLEKLFDPKQYENNKPLIELIHQYVPREMIKLITNLYYKTHPTQKPEKPKVPTEIPRSTRISPPSIPRRRPILQTWRRYNPEQLRTGEFEDE